jgi:nucleoside-diphosphate-sugar epimerase
MQVIREKTVFVTGGSGFVGGRLIEVLVRQFGVKVRALVNRPQTALRLARFPIEFVSGDMTDSAAMELAMSGSDIVFHLAFGKSGTEEEQHRITVDGTRAVLNAAKTIGITRFVNVSTAAVYGTPNAQLIDETFPRVHGSWHYPNMKMDAENLVTEYSKRGDVPATTIQLVGVYGPWGDVFTVDPIRQLKTGIVALPGDGSGITNCTYIDDVIQALLLAAVNDNAVGQTFLVKGPGSVTRKEFLEQYCHMLKDASVRCIPLREMRQMQKAAKWNNTKALIPNALSALKAHEPFKNAVRGSAMFPLIQLGMKLIGTSRTQKTSTNVQKHGNEPTTVEKPYIFPAEFMIPRLMMKTEFNDSKARTELGYAPVYDLEAGMRVTKEWAKWARMI